MLTRRLRLFATVLLNVLDNHRFGAISPARTSPATGSWPTTMSRGPCSLHLLQLPCPRVGAVHGRDGLFGKRGGIGAEDADAHVARGGGVAVGGAKRLCNGEVFVGGAGREQAGRARRPDRPQQQASVDNGFLKPFVVGLVAADYELRAAGQDEVAAHLEKLQFRAVAELAARLDIAQLVAEKLFSEEATAGR